MSTSAKSESPRVDQFFMAGEARFDRWRALLQASRKWERAASQQDSNKPEHQVAVAICFFQSSAVGRFLSSRTNIAVLARGKHKFGRRSGCRSVNSIDR